MHYDFESHFLNIYICTAPVIISNTYTVITAPIKVFLISTEINSLSKCINVQ